MLRVLATSVLAAALAAVPVAHATTPPMVLPGDARAAAAPADRATWIVGARQDPGARRIARRFGAHAAGEIAYEVPRSRARGFARALRRAGLLTFAEPNLLKRPRATGDDPFTSPAGWRSAVVEPGLEPPAVTGSTTKLALIDSKLDASHPEFEGGRITTAGSAPVTDEHGTATAAMAAAPTNGIGIEGVWPGMTATNFATDLRCSDIVRLIKTVMRRGYSVLNMSYGSPEECFAESAQLQRAFGVGILLVAAAGNEFAEGNPLEYPASLPHVLTVAATDLQGNSSYFSNANAAVDLSAPGENVATAVPTSHDPDGDGDGYALMNGTSFAAPIVAGAGAWVREERPELTGDQLSQVIRLSATDLGRTGWDPHSGYGMLDVGAALRFDPPPHDPLEPNEDIFWVNGMVFSKPDPFVFDGSPRSRIVRARLDQYEDPADVYRVRFPARSSVKITVTPGYGDPDLAVFGRSARNTRARAVARSQRSRGRDATTIVNSGRAAAVGFVHVYMDASSPGLDAGYTLKLRRVR